MLPSQPYQGLPQFDTPLAEPESGIITPPWHRFLVSLWLKTGGSSGPAPNSCYIIEDPTTGQFFVYNSLTGELVGVIPIVPAHGGPPEPQSLGASPFTYTPVEIGTLVVTSGQLELKRSPDATWYVVSPNGGALPMLVGDSARVTWYGADPAVVTWFPTLFA